VHISQFSESKYLRKEDVDPAILVTIKGFERVNVGLEGETPRMKIATHFKEDVKPMIVHSTNA
jgi:hypothetical protein